MAEEDQTAKEKSTLGKALNRFQNLREDSPPLFAVTVAAVLIVALLLVSGLAFKTYETIEGPGACGSCHVMDYYVDTWQNSTHAAEGVDCKDCHDKGLGRQTLAEVSESVAWLLHYRGEEGPLEGVHEGATIMENCKDCHERRGVGESDMDGGHGE